MVVFAISVGAASLFVAVTRRCWMRIAGWVVVGIVLLVLVQSAISKPGDLVAVLLVGVLASASVTSGRYATHLDVATLKESAKPGVAVGRAQRGVLIMNPK